MRDLATIRHAYSRYTKYTKYTQYKYCHTKQHKTLIICILFFEIWMFENVGISFNELVYSWCALYCKLLFWTRLSDSLSFSVYRNIFKRYFSTFLKKCPRSVNSFRTNYLLRFEGIWGGPKWSPLPSPSLASTSKFPFGGNKYGKN